MRSRRYGGGLIRVASCGLRVASFVMRGSRLALGERWLVFGIWCIVFGEGRDAGCEIRVAGFELRVSGCGMRKRRFAPLIAVRLRAHGRGAEKSGGWDAKGGFVESRDPCYAPIECVLTESQYRD